MALAINEENNVGSLASVWLALIYQVASINPVVFISGFAWLVVDFLPESGRCQEGTAITDAGIEHTYTLSFAVNTINQDMLDTVKSYIGQLGMIQFSDSNGLTRMIGSPSNPVSINKATDTGQAYSDMNGLVLTATWMDRRAAAVVS